MVSDLAMLMASEAARDWLVMEPEGSAVPSGWRRTPQASLASAAMTLGTWLSKMDNQLSRTTPAASGSGRSGTRRSAQAVVRHQLGHVLAVDHEVPQGAAVAGPPAVGDGLDLLRGVEQRL